MVGIDDWAITRGHRYGTIVVDLVRRCPIEVLDGRESTGVADWFRRHPSIIEPEIGEASSIAREFLGLIHHRNIEQFDRWLKRARESKAREMRRFATGIAADISAVRAAFELPWSSGHVEGQINRLKFLKRQMYGRANLDLLRARVLHPN